LCEGDADELLVVDEYDRDRPLALSAGVLLGSIWTDLG
jgi:hypothetical protein